MKKITQKPYLQQYKENNAKVLDKGELILEAVKNVGRMFRRKTIAVRVSFKLPNVTEQFLYSC